MKLKHGTYVALFAVLLSLMLLIPTACLPLPGNSDYAVNPVSQRETLTQVSTINALMAGVYDGVTTCGDLKTYGDFGVGTFQSLDGEMVVLDGKIYQVKADGVAYAVADSLKTPFAAVTFFDTDSEQKLADISGLDKLQQTLDKAMPSSNIFCAIKIEGTFSYVKTRSVPAQNKPYPPLVEVTKNQPTFELNNVTGTIVGFKCPPYVTGVNVAGYHLHFLNDKKNAGGHLLEAKLTQATVKYDFTPNFLMKLPGPDSDFYKIDLSGNQESDVKKVEK